MAAIGKIRSWGPVLATVIGLAVFFFFLIKLIINKKKPYY